MVIPGIRPIVIAHRGASASRPEHTLEAYALAISRGADFIEPDLVATRDGELIARHENALAVLAPDGELDRTNTSTDVYQRPEFADRLCRKLVDGEPVHGWFSEDFSLAEIRTLRAIERLPALRPANTAYDGQFGIPTLAEILALVRETGRRDGREIGIYPETKHPSYFLHEGHRLGGETIGIDLTRSLLDVLIALDFTDPNRVFIQSFETGNLRELAQRLLPAAGLHIPLIQLIEADGAPRDLVLAGDARGYAELLEPDGLDFIARYATGIGVPKRLVIPDASSAPTRLVPSAHASGLEVHAWTFRPENAFLPPRHQRGTSADAGGALADELAEHLAAGVDGLFIDSPEAGAAAVKLAFPD